MINNIISASGHLEDFRTVRHNEVAKKSEFEETINFSREKNIEAIYYRFYWGRLKTIENKWEKYCKAKKKWKVKIKKKGEETMCLCVESTTLLAKQKIAQTK